jgi:hypothetical protein
MSEKNLESIDIAQNGAAQVNPVPTQLNIETPMLDRRLLKINLVDTKLLVFQSLFLHIKVQTMFILTQLF